MEKGTPTNTIDITGRTICTGDWIQYEFCDENSFFEVVFTGGAFRKRYLNRSWPDDLQLPLLEAGEHAQEMRLLVIDKA